MCESLTLSFCVLSALKITKLMLIKNPNCVETIKRLRRYVGNTKNWEISEDAKKEFIAKTEEVRRVAVEIYDSFKVGVILQNPLSTTTH